MIIVPTPSLERNSSWNDSCELVEGKVVIMLHTHTTTHTAALHTHASVTSESDSERN